MRERRLAIISGGTRGLGRALSLALGRADYRVVALFRADFEAASALEQEMQAAGITGRTLEHDVAGHLPLPAELLCAGRLTLINNAAAPFCPAPLHRADWGEIQAQIDVAVRGSFSLTRQLVPRMAKAKSGDIVSILSAAVGEIAPKGLGPYTVSKYALLGLSRSLAAELNQLGIRVFSVSPSFMETDLTNAWDARFRALAFGTGEVNTPEEVANRVVDLLSSEETPGRGEDHPVRVCPRPAE